MAPRAHPGFRARFTSAIYRSRTDEFAPFGSDEGADLLSEWSARAGELSAASTVRDILIRRSDDPDTEWAQFVADVPNPDLDGFIIAAGFVLLRFTGQIDDQGRALVLQALRRSRQAFPAGASRFDQMTADLGGEVPPASSMSDDLREMIDPDFGPPTPRHAWLFLTASRRVDYRTLPLPMSYQGQLTRIRKALNTDPQWWHWWDAAFLGEPTVLDAEIEFASPPRRRHLGSRRDRDWRLIVVRIGVPSDSIERLSADQFRQASLEYAQLANTHVMTALSAVTTKHGLGPHPELPHPRR